MFDMAQQSLFEIERQEKTKKMSGLEKMEARIDYLNMMRVLKSENEAPVQNNVENAEPKRNEYYHIFKKISWCPTSGCPATFRYSDKKERHYHCEMCQKEYCLDCQSGYHKNEREGGMDCYVW